MEPLPKERVHTVRSSAPSHASSGLNGAAPEGAGSRGGGQWPLRPQHRLNGAAPEGAGSPSPRPGLGTEPGGLNGAAPEGAGSRRSEATPYADLIASMEPLPKERVHDQEQVARAAHADMPQWSRSRRSGFTRTPGAPRRCPLCASMEPLPKERVHGFLEVYDALRTRASMEPLPKERVHEVIRLPLLLG